MTKPVGDAAMAPKFKAMSGRDKWETLVLHGLIGTDEPWIAAMTETLRAEADALTAQAAEKAELVEALGEISSQAVCYGMAADESELRDWLRHISEIAEHTLAKHRASTEVSNDKVD